MKEFNQFITSNSNIKYIYNIIKNEALKNDPNFTYDFFEKHVMVCTNYAYNLGIRRHCDLEIVTIAALLHDFARRKTEWVSKHEYYGALEAEGLLKNINYNDNRILRVQQAILHHQLGKRATITKEAQIIADADAISYIKEFSFFANYLEVNENNKTTICEKLKLKIDDCCAKMSEEAFKLVDNEIANIRQSLNAKHL